MPQAKRGARAFFWGVIIIILYYYQYDKLCNTCRLSVFLSPNDQIIEVSSLLTILPCGSRAVPPLAQVRRRARDLHDNSLIMVHTSVVYQRFSEPGLIQPHIADLQTTRKLIGRVY